MEGPNARPRRTTPVLAGWTMIAANPARGLAGRPEGEARRVFRQSAVHSRCLATGPLTPPSRACGSGSCPAGISPRRSDASSRTPLPRADGMSTKELRPWKGHWARVRSALEAGTYRPQPVRRVMILKRSSGLRMLGCRLRWIGSSDQPLHGRMDGDALHDALARATWKRASWMGRSRRTRSRPGPSCGRAGTRRISPSTRLSARAASPEASPSSACTSPPSR
jgi:hypothetical protein